MKRISDRSDRQQSLPYLSALGAWALACGCSVGWGSFVMPGTTFLPIAGPVGTALGIGIGGIVMLILAVNYHYLMNRFSGGGGVYTYTQKCFGFDHGFVNGWFLILTYVAIIWANATALPSSPGRCWAAFSSSASIMRSRASTSTSARSCWRWDRW